MVRMALSALVFVALGSTSARAQQEVDPDHFDSPDVEPSPRPPMANSFKKPNRYDGNFSLPYTVRCSGKKLAPGTYSVSLRADGRVAHGVLRSAAQAIEVASVVQAQIPKRINDVVVVQSKQNVRTLSAIRIAGLVFVFDPVAADSSVLAKNWHIDRLPLTLLGATQSKSSSYP